MDIRDEVLDEVLSGCEKPEDLPKRLRKVLIERGLGAALTVHLGYEKGDPAGRGTGNIRSGCSRKTLKTDDGAYGAPGIRKLVTGGVAEFLAIAVESERRPVRPCAGG
jgi:hypothetical protein